MMSEAQMQLNWCFYFVSIFLLNHIIIDIFTDGFLMESSNETGGEFSRGAGSDNAFLYSKKFVITFCICEL